MYVKLKTYPIKKNMLFRNNEYQKPNHFHLDETTYGNQYTGLLYDFRGLTEVYSKLENVENFNRYSENMELFYERREAWLHMVHTAVDKNCTKDNLSLDKFKCILNECLCEK